MRLKTPMSTYKVDINVKNNNAFLFTCENHVRNIITKFNHNRKG